MIYYTSCRVRQDWKVLKSSWERKKNKWNFLLTNVDRNDILDKLFRTTEMIETDSEKEK